MDFNDSPEDAKFRTEVQQWLAANAPTYANASTLSEHDYVASAKAWQACKAAAGYAGISKSPSIGGAGRSEMQSIIFDAEENKYDLPLGPVIKIGEHMVVSLLEKHGTPEQIEQFCAPTLKGEITWCQLFSEPGAGSDLANVRTKAIQDGDEWVINGQKVWSSWAHHADWGILLARTDPTQVKHKGLSFFVVNMKSPGIDIRPIRQISGESDFNETFMTDLRLPDSCRVGNIGDGWACAITVLTSERLSSGEMKDSESAKRLIELAQQIDTDSGKAIDSNAVQEKIAYFYSLEQGQRNFHSRLLSDFSNGKPPGAEAALVKYIYSNRLQQSAGFAMELQGMNGVGIHPDDSSAATFYESYIWSTAMRVAGGADEVLLNQIAERVLGMPAEIRGDKNVPFNEL